VKATLILCLVFASVGTGTIIALKLVGATRIWPAALLIVCAPLEVYRSSSSAGANLSVFRFALAAAAVAFVVDLLRGRKRVPRDLPASFLIYGAFVAWQVISYLFVSTNHALAHRFIGQYVAGLLAAFLITCYVERRHLRVIVGLCGAAAILPLLAAVFRVISVSQGGTGDLPGLTELPLNLTIEAARQSGSFLLDGTQRLNATFSDPNLFGFYIAATFCVMVGAACSALFLEQPVRWRAAASYVLLALATAVAVVGTYSRSAWVLAAIGVAVFAALLGRSFWTRKRIIATCLVGVVAIGLASPLIVARVGSSEPGNLKSTQVHETAIRTAIKLVSRHPFIGVGLADYGRYVGEPPIISSAVSTYFTVAAELGIPGLMLLLATILVAGIAAVRSVRASPPQDRLLLAGLVAGFVGLAAANVIYEAWMNDFQWALFGLLLALTAQPRIAIRLVPLRRRREVARPSAAAGVTDQPQVVA
jgi:O-Antigen ligase